MKNNNFKNLQDELTFLVLEILIYFNKHKNYFYKECESFFSVELFTYLNTYEYGKYSLNEAYKKLRCLEKQGFVISRQNKNEVWENSRDNKCYIINESGIYYYNEYKKEYI